MSGGIMSHIHRGMNGRFVNKDGVIFWLKDGQYHREDGPAVETSDGAIYWYIHDKLHREDGSAMITKNGKYWLIEGQNHREDGPAVEKADGTKEWYLNGIQLTEEQFKRETEKKALNEKLHTNLPPKPIVKRGKI